MDCVLQSFAHVTGLSCDCLVKALGHNGREVMGENKYRGFNVFELSRVLFDYGWATTTIYKYDLRHVTGQQPKRLNTIDRIKPYLSEKRYCLSSDDHMIGVRDGVVKDTTGRYTSPDNFPYNFIYIVTYIEG